MEEERTLSSNDHAERFFSAQITRQNKFFLFGHLKCDVCMLQT